MFLRNLAIETSHCTLKGLPESCDQVEIKRFRPTCIQKGVTAGGMLMPCSLDLQGKGKGKSKFDLDDDFALPPPEVQAASVVSVQPHPNADKLKVCSIDTGSVTVKVSLTSTLALCRRC